MYHMASFEGVKAYDIFPAADGAIMAFMRTETSRIVSFNSLFQTEIKQTHARIKVLLAFCEFKGGPLHQISRQTIWKHQEF